MKKWNALIPLVGYIQIAFDKMINIRYNNMPNKEFYY